MLLLRGNSCIYPSSQRDSHLLAAFLQQSLSKLTPLYDCDNVALIFQQAEHIALPVIVIRETRHFI